MMERAAQLPSWMHLHYFAFISERYIEMIHLKSVIVTDCVNVSCAELTILEL